MDKEGFVRWQDRTHVQLGYVVNLFLAFATASLGFGFSFVKEDLFKPNCFVRGCFGLSLLLLAISVLLGMLCAMNRLDDFRKTAAIVRVRDKDGCPAMNDELREMRTRVREIGVKTWNLFHGQLWCFMGGVILLGVALAVAYWNKI